MGILPFGNPPLTNLVLLVRTGIGPFCGGKCGVEWRLPYFGHNANAEQIYSASLVMGVRLNTARPNFNKVSRGWSIRMFQSSLLLSTARIYGVQPGGKHAFTNKLATETPQQDDYWAFIFSALQGIAPTKYVSRIANAVRELPRIP